MSENLFDTLTLQNEELLSLEAEFLETQPLSIPSNLSGHHETNFILADMREQLVTQNILLSSQTRALNVNTQQAFLLRQEIAESADTTLAYQQSHYDISYGSMVAGFLLAAAVFSFIPKFLFP